MVDEQAQATATAAPVRTPESRIIDYFGNPFPIENFLEHKTAVEGIPLYSCRWPATAQPPRGVVIYFTGYGSYVGRYGFIAKFYAERGYDFVAMDYEGYGRSGGPRSVIKSKDGLYEDCTQFLIKVRSYYQELLPAVTLPFITFGYSLGGRVSLGIANKLRLAGQAPLDAQIFVVPGFGIQLQHVPEEFWAELEEKSQDPTQEIKLPPGPGIRDVAHLMPYFKDEKAQMMKHYATTIKVMYGGLAEDQATYPGVTHPVHITIADQDVAVDNVEVRRAFETFGTPPDRKELAEYHSEHIILSDGWLIDEVLGKQIAFLERVLH